MQHGRDVEEFFDSPVHTWVVKLWVMTVAGPCNPEREGEACLPVHIQGVTPISLDEGRRREPAICLAVPATAPELQQHGRCMASKTT